MYDKKYVIESLRIWVEDLRMSASGFYLGEGLIGYLRSQDKELARLADKIADAQKELANYIASRLR